jgi:hypothetical protein
MEILIVVLLVVIVAALAFAWTKFGRGPHARTAGLGGRRGGIRGTRGARAAARHDPMAEAVERHAQATDPHEAAEAELALRAQANRVASDLLAREAAALESEVAGAAPRPSTAGPGYADAEPVYRDEYGQPVYEDGSPAPDPAYEQPARPVYEDGRPAPDPAYEQPARPVYEDEHGRPVYEDDRPRY